jgi:hypothetical protein
VDYIGRICFPQALQMILLQIVNCDDNFTSSSSDGDILEDMDQNDLFIFQTIVVATTFNSNDLLISHDMEEGGNLWTNYWCLRCFQYHGRHTNIIQEFDELNIGGI